VKKNKKEIGAKSFQYMLSLAKKVDVEFNDIKKSKLNQYKILSQFKNKIGTVRLVLQHDS